MRQSRGPRLLTLQEQIYATFLEAGISVRALRDAADLDVDRSAVSKMLRSKAGMTLDRAERIAKVLGHELVLVRRAA